MSWPCIGDVWKSAVDVRLTCMRTRLHAPGQVVQDTLAELAQLLEGTLCEVDL